MIDSESINTKKSHKLRKFKKFFFKLSLKDKASYPKNLKNSRYVKKYDS